MERMVKEIDSTLVEHMAEMDTCLMPPQPNPACGSLGSRTAVSGIGFMGLDKAGKVTPQVPENAGPSELISIWDQLGSAPEPISGTPAISGPGGHPCKVRVLQAGDQTLVTPQPSILLGLALGCLEDLATVEVPCWCVIQHDL